MNVIYYAYAMHKLLLNVNLYTINKFKIIKQTIVIIIFNQIDILLLFMKVLA